MSAATTIASRKAKARRLQNLIEARISKLINLPCGPDCPVEARQMGQTGVDIRLDDNARKLFPFSVEAKNSEAWDVHGAIKQAKANVYQGTDWLVVMCRNRQDPVVILDMEAFFKILEKTLSVED